MAADDPIAGRTAFSVVICTRDRPWLLELCIRAVKETADRPVEVVVVDSAPSDDRARQVALRQGVRYLREQRPGLSRARNAGARAALGELVAFIDDDARPVDNWPWAFAPAFTDPRVGAVTGQVLPPGLDLQVEHLLTVTGGYPRGNEPFSVTKTDPGWFETAAFGGLGIANMAFRRCVFDEWRGFDERLGRGAAIDGGEEHYAFVQLIDRGYTVSYTPLAKVRHPYGRTWPQARARYIRDRAAAAAYFMFLLAERPGNRADVMRHIAKIARGNVAKLRDSSVRTRIVPPGRKLLALAGGALLFIRYLRYPPEEGG